MLVTNTRGDHCDRGGVGANIYGRIIQASHYTRSPMYYADTRIDFQYLACETAAKAKLAFAHAPEL